jgi:ferredoxin
LPVGEKVRIKSPECTGCLTCVSHCPAKGALDMPFIKSRVLNLLVFAILVIALFFGAIGIGKSTDKWNSTITYEEYKGIIPEASMLEHP